jgi:hypothetical protein
VTILRTSLLARKIYPLVAVSVISDGEEWRTMNADNSRAHYSKINISEIPFSK